MDLFLHAMPFKYWTLTLVPWNGVLLDKYYRRVGKYMFCDCNFIDVMIKMAQLFFFYKMFNSYLSEILRKYKFLQ